MCLHGREFWRRPHSNVGNGRSDRISVAILGLWRFRLTLRRRKGARIVTIYMCLSKHNSTVFCIPLNFYLGFVLRLEIRLMRPLS